MRKNIHRKLVKLPLDTRNRVCLSQFLPKDINISSFNAHQEGDKIILEPMMEIPAATMASVLRGIKDIKERKTSKLDRDFSEFLNDDEI